MIASPLSAAHCLRCWLSSPNYAHCAPPPHFYFYPRAGRAVVITGLPLPPFMDPKVVLKREYLNEGVKRAKKEGISTADVLTGDEWYTQQAMRAINQAVGRVIRHRNDYGAVLLCDDRFEQPKYCEALSLWLRPRVTIADSFGDVNAKLNSFFKEQV
ncbi:helicase C-terminal domain-containing protein [Pavlovales sp. CCMP2436]|nr:helicase C-terminal domain-containing protein [Pavlovales sp. CCMP2436]